VKFSLRSSARCRSTFDFDAYGAARRRTGHEVISPQLPVTILVGDLFTNDRPPWFVRYPFTCLGYRLASRCRFSTGLWQEPASGIPALLACVMNPSCCQADVVSVVFGHTEVVCGLV